MKFVRFMISVSDEILKLFLDFITETQNQILI